MHRINQFFSVDYSYSVYFTQNIFDIKNTLLRDSINSTPERPIKVAVVVDNGVSQANPTLISDINRYAHYYSQYLNLVAPPWGVEGGELCKNTQHIPEQLYNFCQQTQLCRHSFIIAMGGGAVIDAVGYAAATAHRGIKLVRMPTTVLGQNDAGVGVKNAINWRGRKNFIGTFAIPHAVINDFSILASLETRDKIAGLAEAIKVALIKDTDFFRYLYDNRFRLANLQQDVLEHSIIQCASLHLRHIREGADPFETGNARPLDFGHWLAHKLEELSQHTLRHGEAVAIGIALDSLYSKKVGLINASETRQVLDTLVDIGLPTYHPCIEAVNIPQALAEFREHLGGELCITLLTGLGRHTTVNRVNSTTMQHCVEQLKRIHSMPTPVSSPFIQKAKPR